MQTIGAPTYRQAKELAMFRAMGDRTVLNTGFDIPWLGLALHAGASPHARLTEALHAGYRRFDVSELGEENVTHRLHDHGISRDDVVISAQFPEVGDIDGFRRWLRRRGLKQLDIGLLSCQTEQQLLPAWRLLEQLHDSGLIHTIGACDLDSRTLAQLIDAARVRPAINQLTQRLVTDIGTTSRDCAANNVQLLMAAPLHPPQLDALAKIHHRTNEQILLRWLLQKNVPITTTVSSAQQICDQAAIFDFSLPHDHETHMDVLNKGRHIETVPAFTDGRAAAQVDTPGSGHDTYGAAAAA